MCDTECNILKFLGINSVICRLLRSSVVTLWFRAYSSLISSGENFVHLIIRSLIEHFEPVWGFVVPNAVKNMTAKMNSFSLAIVVSSSTQSFVQTSIKPRLFVSLSDYFVIYLFVTLGYFLEIHLCASQV